MGALLSVLKLGRTRTTDEGATDLTAASGICLQVVALVSPTLEAAKQAAEKLSAAFGPVKSEAGPRTRATALQRGPRGFRVPVLLGSQPGLRRLGPWSLRPGGMDQTTDINEESQPSRRSADFSASAAAALDATTAWESQPVASKVGL